jgi:hypothetical protein
MRWIIGDVHGMRLALESLLAAIRQRDPSPRFYFTGDYVNRGPDSRGVLNLLLSLDNAIFVRGNHDDILDIILHGDGFVDHPQKIDAVAAFRWFMQHGLAETLMSYGAEYEDLEYAASHPTEKRIAEVMSIIPPAHRAFLRGLGPVHEEPDFFVLHAMWDVDEPDSDIPARLGQSPQERFKALWGRYNEPQIARKKRWRRTGFFGHTPVQTYSTGEYEPLRGPQIVLLDTGAALGPSGRLSAVCVESGDVVQVHRSGKLVEEK